MAYETTDKQELVHILHITDFSELRISTVKTENDCFKAIDVRTWYCTKTDSEMKPTQKGVRVRKEDLAEVISTLIQNADFDVRQQLKERGYSGF